MAVSRQGCYLVVFGVALVLCFCIVIYSGRLTVRHSPANIREPFHISVPLSSQHIPNPFHLINATQVSALFFLLVVTFLFVKRSRPMFFIDHLSVWCVYITTDITICLLWQNSSNDFVRSFTCSVGRLSFTSCEQDLDCFIFTAQCTLVQSAVLRSHMSSVCLSVCDVRGLWSHI